MKYTLYILFVVAVIAALRVGFDLGIEVGDSERLWTTSRFPLFRSDAMVDTSIEIVVVWGEMKGTHDV